ncbi:MAG: hypothetical protein Alpg2KO_31630 [Alphaproteobacteria bacterium]
MNVRPQNRTAYIRLQVEGGDRAKREFRSVADAGDKSLSKLRPAARRTRTELDDLADATSRNSARFHVMAERARRNKTALGQMTNTVSGLTAALAAGGVAAVGFFGTQFVRSSIETTMQLDAMDRAMKQATGSFEAAAEEMGFVREESDRLGLELLTTTQGYTKLASAARGTSLEGEQTRQLFLGISEASVVLGLNAEKTSGALTAVEQIMSKGKVSAEELRGQLGERIPGAFQIAARAMGVTTQELDKMLQQGELMADEFLPKFARQLRKEFGEAAVESASSAQAEFNRFNNALIDMQRRFANSGVLDGVTEGVRDLTDVLSDPNVLNAMDDLGSALAWVIGLAGDTAKGIAAVYGEVSALYDQINELSGGAMNVGSVLPGSQAITVGRGLTNIGQTVFGPGGVLGSDDVQFNGLDQDLANRLVFLGNAGKTSSDVQADITRRLAEQQRLQAKTGGDAVDRKRRTARLAELDRMISLDRAAIEEMARREAIITEINTVTPPGMRVPPTKPTVTGGTGGTGGTRTRSKGAGGARRDRSADVLQGIEEELRAEMRLQQARQIGETAEREAQITTAQEQALKRAGIDLSKQLSEAELQRVMDIRAGVRQLKELEFATKDAEQAARDHAKAEAEVGQAIIDLKPASEQARQAAIAWRDAQLDALDKTSDGYEELARQIEEVYAARMKEAAKQARDEATDALSGIQRGLAAVRASAKTDAELMEEAVVGGFKSMEDALVEFSTTGKLEFGDLVSSILADLNRIAIQKTITQPLAAGLESAFDGFASGGGGDLFGGIFGSLFGGSDSFNAAPIIPVETAPLAAPLPRASLSAPQVRVIDQRRNAPAVEQQVTTRADGTRDLKIMIRDEVSDQITSGQHDRALANSFGLNRRGS